METWRSGVNPNLRRGAQLQGRRVGPQLKEKELRPHQKPPELWRMVAAQPRKVVEPLQKRVSPSLRQASSGSSEPVRITDTGLWQVSGGWAKVGAEHLFALAMV